MTGCPTSPRTSNASGSAGPSDTTAQQLRLKGLPPSLRAALLRASAADGSAVIRNKDKVFPFRTPDGRLDVTRRVSTISSALFFGAEVEHSHCATLRLLCFSGLW